MIAAAREAMAEALARWHNPSSPHAEGRAAKAALEDARARIAAALGWSGEIVFTSGASEALAIALTRTKAGTRFVGATEHDAVFRAAPEAVKLPVDADGIVDVEAVSGEWPLVAIQHANNETGVVQPLDEFAAEVRRRGGSLLADCAQSATKTPLPDVDMIALSGHKFGGPPGIGALLLRDFAAVAPTGGQEQGYRSGTENLPGIMAMAAAMEADRSWLNQAKMLRQRLETAILAAGGEIVAAASVRIDTIGAYRMPGLAANAQLVAFDLAGVAVSAGSACSSGSLKTSHVLTAMGLPVEVSAEVVRVSFGRTTTVQEVDRFADLWTQMAQKRRAG